MSLLGGLTESIEAFILTVGYPGLFTIMFVEGVVTPIPSEAIVPFAGSLAAQSGSGFTLPLVILIASLGAMAGAIGAYYIGRHLGRPFILRYGKIFGLTEWHMKQAEAWFAKYGNFGILLGHAIPGVRSFISFPAGLGKMKVTNFAVFTFAGAMAWNTVLAVAGFLLVDDLKRIADTIEFVDYIVIGAAVVAVVGFILWRRRRHAAKA